MYLDKLDPIYDPSKYFLIDSGSANIILRCRACEAEGYKTVALNKAHMDTLKITEGAFVNIAFASTKNIQAADQVQLHVLEKVGDINMYVPPDDIVILNQIIEYRKDNAYILVLVKYVTTNGYFNVKGKITDKTEFIT
jgi:hypothetical protein